VGGIWFLNEWMPLQERLTLLLSCFVRTEFIPLVPFCIQPPHTGTCPLISDFSASRNCGNKFQFFIKYLSRLFCDSSAKQAKKTILLNLLIIFMLLDFTIYPLSFNFFSLFYFVILLYPYKGLEFFSSFIYFLNFIIVTSLNSSTVAFIFFLKLSIFPHIFTSLFTQLF
jgi:hypothetical protein